MKTARRQPGALLLLFLFAATLPGLGCVGVAELVGEGGLPATDTAPAATAPLPSVTPTEVPLPAPTLSLVPEGGKLVRPEEFSSPVEVAARLDGLPTGDLMIWSESDEERGLTSFGYVTFDGEVGDLLTVSKPNAGVEVAGVGRYGQALVIKGDRQFDETYVVDFGSGEVWGYRPACGSTFVDAGDQYIRFGCVETATVDFVTFQPPHAVVQGEEVKPGTGSVYWWPDGQVVLNYWFEGACLYRVAPHKVECANYLWNLGHINASVGQVEVRELWDGRQRPLDTEGCLSADCLWEGPEACEPVWFNTGLMISVSEFGVWMPGGGKILLAENSDSGVKPLNLWQMDTRTGALRFVGDFTTPWIQVQDDRGVALVAPDGRVVVRTKRPEDTYWLLSLDTGKLSHLIGEEGRELKLNTRGLLHVP